VRGPTARNIPNRISLCARPDKNIQRAGYVLQTVAGFLKPLQNCSDDWLKFRDPLRISPHRNLLQLNSDAFTLGFAATPFRFQKFVQLRTQSGFLHQRPRVWPRDRSHMTRRHQAGTDPLPTDMIRSLLPGAKNLRFRASRISTCYVLALAPAHRPARADAVFRSRPEFPPCRLSVSIAALTVGKAIFLFKHRPGFTAGPFACVRYA
jgi:hypothetical protein